MDILDDDEDSDVVHLESGRVIPRSARVTTVKLQGSGIDTAWELDLSVGKVI